MLSSRLVSSSLFVLVASLSYFIVSHYTLRWSASSHLEQQHDEWEPLRKVIPSPSPWLNLALEGNHVATAGPLEWNLVGDGIEVAELQAFVGSRLVDTIHLVKLDPSLFTFRVYSDPNGHRNIDEWAETTGAVVVCNGSSTDKTGYPIAPLKSDGRLMGPKKYSGSDEAFLASETGVSIVPVRNSEWQTALAPVSDAIVSSPLLTENHRTTTDSPREIALANRSFIGQERSGRIILGTTAYAFFSPPAFSKFLSDSPLHLERALNLEGGTVAAQAVRTPQFSRTIYGRWNIGGSSRHPQVVKRDSSGATSPLPLVLAVYRKPPAKVH